VRLLPSLILLVQGTRVPSVTRTMSLMNEPVSVPCHREPAGQAASSSRRRANQRPGRRFLVLIWYWGGGSAAARRLCRLAAEAEKALS